MQTREWLIEPGALQAMASTAQRIDAPQAFLAAAPAPEPATLLTVQNGIGTIDISGPIFRRPGLISRLFLGATDSEEIAAAIREAGERSDVKAVMLDIDSPGGTVLGTPELAAAVRELDRKKPVYAFTSGLMASAAYWIASQARAIYATPSAVVGSIGVVQAVLDQSAALDKAGLKVEVFSVGKYKAMGAPGTSLTDEQRDLIQSNLEEVAADFHAAVLSRGRSIPAEAMEGQTFSGKQAQRLNLAGVVPDRLEALRRLSTYSAVVDTGARIMSEPIAVEDQLAAASAELAEVRESAEAQAASLSESSEQLAAVTAERDQLAAGLEPIKAALLAAEAEVEGLRAEVETLKAAQIEFDAAVQAEAAKIVAQTGTSIPAAVAPSGGSVALTRAEFNALPHAARNDFFRRGGRISD